MAGEHEHTLIQTTDANNADEDGVSDVARGRGLLGYGLRLEWLLF